MAFDAAARAPPGGGARRASAGAGSAFPSSAGAAPAETLQELSQRIYTMSQSCASVEQLGQQLGGPGDTTQLRARIEGHERAALALQAEVDGGVRRLRAALMAGADHHAQRQLKRLDEQYAEARDRLARVLGDSRQVRRQYAPLEAPPAAPAASRAPAPTGFAAPRPPGAGSGQGPGGGAAAAAGPQFVQLQLLQGLSEVDAAIIEERTQEALAIAQESSALHRTQQDLSALVGEQGETIDHVEAHVEKAVEGVAAGTRALVEAQAYQNSYRCKCCVAWALIAVLVTAIAVPLALHYTPGSAPHIL